MRLVLDSDVFIAGVRSRLGASRLVLESGLRQRFAWLVSPALFLEYEAVLLRQQTL
jgi:predicted nucleic acid-binding protein